MMNDVAPCCKYVWILSYDSSTPTRLPRLSVCTYDVVCFFPRSQYPQSIVVSYLHPSNHCRPTDLVCPFCFLPPSVCSLSVFVGPPTLYVPFVSFPRVCVPFLFFQPSLASGRIPSGSTTGREPYVYTPRDPSLPCMQTRPAPLPGSYS